MLHHLVIFELQGIQNDGNTKSKYFYFAILAVTSIVPSTVTTQKSVTISQPTSVKTSTIIAPSTTYEMKLSTETSVTPSSTVTYPKTTTGNFDMLHDYIKEDFQNDSYHHFQVHRLTIKCLVIKKYAY